MKSDTKSIDKKAGERDTSVAVDPRQRQQIERAQRGEGTLEGAGGWAALATQRSTAHVVDPTRPAPVVDQMKPMVVDPSDGSESPTLLEDQLASNAGIQKETEKLLNTDTSGSRAEHPAGNQDKAKDGESSDDDNDGDDEDAVDPYQAVEYVNDDAKSEEENKNAKELHDSRESARIAALPAKEAVKPKPAAKKETGDAKKTGGIKSRTKAGKTS